jgi:hypothetical protein
MEQSSPWEAERHAASQSSPSFYRIRRFIIMFTRTRQLSLFWATWILTRSFYPNSLNSFLTFLPHTSLGFLIIGTFTSSFRTRTLSLLLSHVCYQLRPSHPPWFVCPNDIWRGVQTMKLSFCICLQSRVTSSLLGPITPLRILFSNTLSLYSFLSVGSQVSTQSDFYMDIL